MMMNSYLILLDIVASLIIVIRCALCLCKTVSPPAKHANIGMIYLIVKEH
jgi:hypothetical protein